MRKMIIIQLALICLTLLLNLTACSMAISNNNTMAQPQQTKPQPAIKTENIDISKIKDTCKLGSPITIEQTVQQGWDEDGEAIMTAIVKAVQEAGVTDGMLQVEAIGKINNYLCNRTVYGENPYCRTPRGALILHQAVCVGYTLAFQYMAQYCGIQAVYVHGYTKTAAHGWSGVYFSDGSYLEVDVTMNDTSGRFDKYLLITASEMYKLHYE